MQIGDERSFNMKRDLLEVLEKRKAAPKYIERAHRWRFNSSHRPGINSYLRYRKGMVAGFLFAVAWGWFIRLLQQI